MALHAFTFRYKEKTNLSVITSTIIVIAILLIFVIDLREVIPTWFQKERRSKRKCCQYSPK